MKHFGMLAAVALFGFGCGSVQDETKKAEPAKAECTDAPGKVFIVLMNDAGKSVCNASAEMELANGQKGSKNAGALDGAGDGACGFEFGPGGSATVKAAGFGPKTVSWDQPAKCQTNTIKVTLQP